MSEWIVKMWSVHTMGSYLALKKKNEIVKFAGK